MAGASLTDMISDSHADPELLWVETCERADRAFITRRFHAAAECWQQAARLIHPFDACDPRRAASLNNLGVARRCLGELDQAEIFYHQAEAGWKSSIDWIGRMQPAPRARSSLFHLRMEARHRRGYDRPYINKYQLWLRAGLAATLNNSAELRQANGRLRDAERDYLRALAARSTAMLPRDFGRAVILANLEGLTDTRLAAVKDGDAARIAAFAPGFTEQAGANGWVIDHPPVFTDEGRLMAALLCTRISGHASLSGSRGDA